MPQEPWGGDLHMPRWLRHVLHRPEPAGDTPEAAHEKRKPQDMPSVAQNADRAAVGPMSSLYVEGRGARRKASPRGDKR
jgi:hypothetical protein